MSEIARQKKVIWKDDIIFTREARDVLEKIKPASHRPEVILFSRANSYLLSPVSHLTHKHALHKTLQATTTHSYVINHKAQLDALNLDYEFVEAVDGTLMTADERAAASAPINYAFLPGEIGCALSHQKIYQKIVDSNIEAAMILEVLSGL
ncbi:hypothetical protein CRX72_19935 [Pantoea sp. BRM17]|nr:hypothetical protein CRX72_19935 [Pantoea sp. BRM17]